MPDENVNAKTAIKMPQPSKNHLKAAMVERTNYEDFLAVILGFDSWYTGRRSSWFSCQRNTETRMASIVYTEKYNLFNTKMSLQNASFLS